MTYNFLIENINNSVILAGLLNKMLLKQILEGFLPKGMHTLKTSQYLCHHFSIEFFQHSSNSVENLIFNSFKN